MDEVQHVAVAFDSTLDLLDGQIDPFGERVGGQAFEVGFQAIPMPFVAGRQLFQPMYHGWGGSSADAITLFSSCPKSTLPTTLGEELQIVFNSAGRPIRLRSGTKAVETRSYRLRVEKYLKIVFTLTKTITPPVHPNHNESVSARWSPGYSRCPPGRSCRSRIAPYRKETP